MSIDKGKISCRHLMLSVICFIQASALLAAYVTGVTMQDSWLVMIIATLLCVPLLWVFRTLMLAFPDLNLIQMLEVVFGKAIGKVLGAMYVWFFLTLSSLNLLDLGDLSKLTIMEELSSPVLMLLCVLVAAYTVRSGIKTVTWYGTLFVMIAFGFLFLSLLLTSTLMDFEHFLPMMRLPAIRYIQGVHIVLTIPLGELVVLLMLTPNVNCTRRTLGRHLYTGLFVGALGFFLVMVREIAVLGNLLDVFTTPALVTLRLVHLGDALNRVEILYMISFVVLLYFKITLLYYATVMAIAQLFGTTSFRNLTLAAGVLMVVYGHVLYDNPLEHTGSGRDFTAIVWTLFEILIPALLLVVAKLRKLPARVEG